jgi:hypothetical protein
MFSTTFQEWIPSAVELAIIWCWKRPCHTHGIIFQLWDKSGTTDQNFSFLTSFNKEKEKYFWSGSLGFNKAEIEFSGQKCLLSIFCVLE